MDRERRSGVRTLTTTQGHCFGFKILNFNILGGFQKNDYFLGYENFVDIFFFWGGGVIIKIGLYLLYLGVISMHFKGIFLRSSYRMGDIFLVAKISQKNGVHEIPDIFFFCFFFRGGGER